MQGEREREGEMEKQRKREGGSKSERGERGEGDHDARSCPPRHLLLVVAISDFIEQLAFLLPRSSRPFLLPPSKQAIGRVQQSFEGTKQPNLPRLR